MAQVEAIEATVHDIADQIMQIVDKVRPTLDKFPPGVEVLEGANNALDSLTFAAQQLKSALLQIKGSPAEKKEQLERSLQATAEILHTAQGAMQTLASEAQGVIRITLISARTSLAIAEIRAAGRGTPLG